LIIQASITEKDYSATMLESYDHVNGKIKTVFEMPNKVFNMSLEMGNLNLIYKWNSDHHFGEPSNCAAYVLSDMHTRGGRRHFDLRTHKMINPEQAVGFIESNETYVGKGSARGITTDVWTSSASHSFNRSGMAGHVAYNLTHHFLDGSWKTPVRGDVAHAVPVRVTLKGEMSTGAFTQPFDHVYDYVEFESFDDKSDAQKAQHWAWNHDFMPPAQSYIFDNIANPEREVKLCNSWLDSGCEEVELSSLCDTSDYCARIKLVSPDISEADFQKVCSHKGLEPSRHPHFAEKEDEGTKVSLSAMAGTGVACLLGGIVFGLGYGGYWSKKATLSASNGATQAATKAAAEQKAAPALDQELVPVQNDQASV
jgi:hypothetical protein